MRFVPTVFSSLLKVIDRRQFQASVTRHRGDYYTKTLSSWEHLVALIYGQLSGAESLRAIEAGLNAQSHQHYHLGVRTIARSTLGDANKRRDPAIFTDVLASLIGQLGRKARKNVTSAMAMIDSTSIPLGDRFDCATYNGRIKGLKLHVLFDPDTPCPLHTDITPATVNDISFADQIPLEAGMTYVFDKGYYSFAWWSQIHAARAFFVTRVKTNTTWKVLHERPLCHKTSTKEDGFTLLSDQDVAIASKGDKPRKLTLSPRLVTLKREDGRIFTLITNDKIRPARDIALCYKARWSIELFFKWVKQNLNLHSFLGRNENAVRIQIIVAMITFTLLQIARITTKSKHSPQRFKQLAASLLPTRRHLQNLEKPPPINPSKRYPQNPNQLSLSWSN
jgi:putative transposase